MNQKLWDRKVSKDILELELRASSVRHMRDALRAGTPHSAWIDVQSEPLSGGLAIEQKIILHDECRDCSVELATRCWFRSESGKYPDADLFQARNLLPLLDELGLELAYGWPTDYASLCRFDDPQFHRFQYVELEVKVKR